MASKERGLPEKAGRIKQAATALVGDRGHQIFRPDGVTSIAITTRKIPGITHVNIDVNPAFHDSRKWPTERTRIVSLPIKGDSMSEIAGDTVKLPIGVRFRKNPNEAISSPERAHDFLATLLMEKNISPKEFEEKKVGKDGRTDKERKRDGEIADQFDTITNKLMDHAITTNTATIIKNVSYPLDSHIITTLPLYQAEYSLDSVVNVTITQYVTDILGTTGNKVTVNPLTIESGPKEYRVTKNKRLERGIPGEKGTRPLLDENIEGVLTMLERIIQRMGM